MACGGHPTVVQNVETLANLPAIVRRGGQAFLASGTQATPGTKLVTDLRPWLRCARVTGGGCLWHHAAPDRVSACRRHGERRDGSCSRGRWPEGGVLPLNLLDTPFDYEPLEEVGAIVGSSLIEVVPRDTCMVQWAPSARLSLRRVLRQVCAMPPRRQARRHAAGDAHQRPGDQ